MSEITKEEIKKFQEEILDWFEKNKRDLPWRKSRDPYKILVSEVMLQQTQVSRVIPKYKAWFVAFPTLQLLANAKTADVLRLWSGLGYNRRALYLQQAAKKINTDYKGEFPRTETDLRGLPGIGEYTARAVLCFAFDKQIAVVDTNVRKVIFVKFYKNHPEGAKRPKDPQQVSKTEGILRYAQNDIKKIAEQLLPKGKAYEWNQALMDYSSMELRKVSQRLIGLWPKKIPLKKQSDFKTSNRYFRGQVIKLLLEKKKLTKKEAYLLFEELYGKGDKGRLEAILTQLEKDTFIVIKNNTILLVE